MPEPSFAVKWDRDNERFYETGTDRGVLYVKNQTGTAYNSGVAWNGLTAVTENPSGAEETALYADNKKYLSLRSKEEFGATVEAYTYPDEWAVCDGSAELAPGVYVGQQTRRGFGMTYRTRIGNDTQFDDFGYKVHIIYNGMASPSQKSYATINDSPEAITFSWELTTIPVDMPVVDGTQLKPSATITIDSTKFAGETDHAKLQAIESILYGTDAVYEKVTSPTGNPKTLNYYVKDTSGSYVATTDTTVTEGVDYYSIATPATSPRLPSPSEILEILSA